MMSLKRGTLSSLEAQENFPEVLTARLWEWE
jgi:hypothetical protein